MASHGSLNLSQVILNLEINNWSVNSCLTFLSAFLCSYFSCLYCCCCKVFCSLVYLDIAWPPLFILMETPANCNFNFFKLKKLYVSFIFAINWKLNYFIFACRQVCPRTLSKSSTTYQVRVWAAGQPPSTWLGLTCWSRGEPRSWPKLCSTEGWKVRPNQRTRFSPNTGNRRGSTQTRGEPRMPDLKIWRPDPPLYDTGSADLHVPVAGHMQKYD